MNANPPNNNILIYRDKLFLASESFIHRCYMSFENLTPVYIGNGKNHAPTSNEVIRLEEVNGHSKFHNLIFKQAGLVSKPLNQEMMSYAPKLVHAHFGKSGTYAMPIAKSLNLPLVVTFHGGDATKTQHYKWAPWRVYNRRHKKLFAECDSILAVSKFIKRKLIEVGAPEEKIKVHYNGIDRTKFNTGEKNKEILFAGRMVEKKGIDTLVEALSIAKSALEGWQVRFLGEGPFKKYAEEHLKNSGVNTIFEGWINSDQIPKFLEKTAIVVVPSRTAASGDSEGLPMIALEGMMSGCAVIGSSHAGIPEAIDHNKNGLIFEEGNAAALAKAFENLCGDETKWQEFGQKGIEIAKEKFCLETQSKRLEEHLNSIIEKSRRP